MISRYGCTYCSPFWARSRVRREKTDGSLNLFRSRCLVPASLASFSAFSPPRLTRAAHARTLPSPYAMIPSLQTRRSTRRSLPNAQGVENDVANRMSSTAAGRANNALATGSAAVKPPTNTKVVAGTSNQARRPLATGKAVLADKVCFFLLLRLAACGRARDAIVVFF